MAKPKATEMMSMIIVTDNLDALGKKLMPDFVKKKSVDLSDKTPLRFGGGPVFVYSQRSNKTFAYIGVARGAKLDGQGVLRFTSYERFDNPVVACDEAHGIDRRDLYAPNRGFGPDSFNYITREASAAIERASTNTAERLVWQAITNCPSKKPTAVTPPSRPPGART
jgi:hypothetical protein